MSLAQPCAMVRPGVYDTAASFGTQSHIVSVATDPDAPEGRVVTITRYQITGPLAVRVLDRLGVVTNLDLALVAPAVYFVERAEEDPDGAFETDQSFTFEIQCAEHRVPFDTPTSTPVGSIGQFLTWLEGSR